MRINEARSGKCCMGCNKKTWFSICVLVALMYEIMASRRLVHEIFLVKQDQQNLQCETLLYFSLATCEGDDSPKYQIINT